MGRVFGSIHSPIPRRSRFCMLILLFAFSVTSWKKQNQHNHTHCNSNSIAFFSSYTFLLFTRPNCLKYRRGMSWSIDIVMENWYSRSLIIDRYQFYFLSMNIASFSVEFDEIYGLKINYISFVTLYTFVRQLLNRLSILHRFTQGRVLNKGLRPRKRPQQNSFNRCWYHYRYHHCLY
jgi:hypothetical protein